jgi:hypothetical protein
VNGTPSPPRRRSRGDSSARALFTVLAVLMLAACLIGTFVATLVTR